LTFIELCQQLLPGSQDELIDGFSLAQLETFKARFPNRYEEIENSIHQFNQLVAGKIIEHLGEAFMHYIKKNNASLHKQFRLELLTIYLSNQDLLKKLRLPNSSLYPQGQHLDNMNFELLEPVYERGPIWHKVD
jgi:hypothetical protein